MKSLEEILGPAVPERLQSQYAIAAARWNNEISWLLLDRDNLVLDLSKWRNEFVTAGYDVPAVELVAAQRSGIVIVDHNSVSAFMGAAEVRTLSIEFLRQALIERFPSARSWWDVEFLFPIAFIDFDNKRLAAFYHNGPPLERYVPEGWIGEFVDFANSYSEEIFPARDKFWIADGRDLLCELNERGRDTDGPEVVP